MLLDQEKEKHFQRSRRNHLVAGWGIGFLFVFLTLPLLKYIPNMLMRLLVICLVGQLFTTTGMAFGHTIHIEKWLHKKKK